MSAVARLRVVLDNSAGETFLPPGWQRLVAYLPALVDCAYALQFHNQTPSGQTRGCLPGCVACAALARLEATR